MKPYDIVAEFEKQVAEFAGSKYGVAVESGTAALFLSLQYVARVSGYRGEITIPARTYPSVPCTIIQAGFNVKFYDAPWFGAYQLEPTRVIDSALRFYAGMFIPGYLYCLSFHVKKHLPIGRGGMILTDDTKAVDWLKRARFDGRPEKPLNEGDITMLGWNMYMTPEQAARGLMLLQNIPSDNEDLDSAEQGYPDLSKIGVYQQ